MTYYQLNTRNQNGEYFSSVHRLENAIAFAERFMAIGYRLVMINPDGQVGYDTALLTYEA